jgi:predicted DNA repair protein MutK
MVHNSEQTLVVWFHLFIAVFRRNDVISAMQLRGVMYVCYESTEQLQEQLNNQPNNKLIQCHRVFCAELATNIEKKKIPTC